MIEERTVENSEADDIPSHAVETSDIQATEKVQGVQREVNEVVFQKRLGIKPYKIRKPSEESIEEWTREIDETISEIKAGNIDNIMKKKSGKHIGNPAKIHEMIEAEQFDDTDIKLLAIGIFILKNKSPWGKGNIRTKVLKGEDVRMEELLTEEGRTNCIDGAAVAKELAAHYGITGQVKTTLLHGFFQADEGQVLDTFYGHARGGVFKTHKQYKEFVRKMDFRDRFGVRLNFLRGKNQ